MDEEEWESGHAGWSGVVGWGGTVWGGGGAGGVCGEPKGRRGGDLGLERELVGHESHDEVQEGVHVPAQVLRRWRDGTPLGGGGSATNTERNSTLQRKSECQKHKGSLYFWGVSYFL